MTFSKRRIWQLSAMAAGLVLVAGLVAPWLDVDRFGDRVTRSLEQALGRKVEHGSVHLNLFSGPGFSIDKVVIYDQAGTGDEPFAYVEELEARVSLRSLWGGQLEFSNLRLVSPNVTFTKKEGEHWNFEPLIARTVGAAQQAGVRLPDIEIRDGRINFKFGDTKSIFYLTEMAIDAQPPNSASGAWRLRMEGQPARTDRTAYGFGVFATRGNWWPDARTGGRVDFTLNLEESSLAEWIRLVQGHDAGVHGEIASRARLSGPLSAIELSGEMHIGDIHRWDLPVPRTAGWDLSYRGRVDLISQTLEVASVPPAGSEAQPVVCRVRATGYLTKPRWAASMTLHEVPLAPLGPILQHMGVRLPESLAIGGNASGMLAYGPGIGIEGALAARSATLTVADSAPITFDRVQIVIDGSNIHLAPAVFHVGAGQPAKIEGDYSWVTDLFAVTVSADAMNFAKPTTPANAWMASIPFVSAVEKGAWSGSLSYRQQGARAGRWQANLNIKNARVPLEGFADPLELTSAALSLDGDNIALHHIAGRIGRVDLKGEYEYQPEKARQHQFHISIPNLDAGDLEALLLPALTRDQGFLARTLRLGRTKPPEWLETRHAEGTIEIGSLLLGDRQLERLRTHLQWDGDSVELGEIAGKFAGGSVQGHLGEFAPSRAGVPAERTFPQRALDGRAMGWKDRAGNLRHGRSSAGEPSRRGIIQEP